MVKKSVVKKLLRFRSLLENSDIPVTHMIVFGSYAFGNPRPESDIDVCVVSPKLGKNRIEEGKMLFLLAIKIDAKLEPVAFSSSQFRNDKLSPLLHEIRKNGIRVH